MDDDPSSTGIVYVLTNPAMPGIVKIGRTTRSSIDARLNELYSTGVPVPFECAFAGRVADEGRVERAFHLETTQPIRHAEAGDPPKGARVLDED